MPKNPEYIEHKIVWTRENCSRFWNYIAAQSVYQNLYFSKLAGEDLIRHVKAHEVSLKGRVLDFGCGTGHLLEKLISCGIPCEGADFSQGSLIQAGTRLGKSPLLRGLTHIEELPTPFQDNAFAVVFMVEIVEHVLEGDLDALISEVHRILEPGGCLVVTTPNEEDLLRGETICPECGCVYHGWQHVRSWSAEELDRKLSGFGFEKSVCKAVHLAESSFAQRMSVLLSKLRGKKPPHLLFIGRKIQESARGS